MTGAVTRARDPVAAALPPGIGTRCRGHSDDGDAAEDDALVGAALADDPGALEALARRYRSRLYGYAVTMLRSAEDAEDVAQEALLRAFGSLRGYRERGCFRAWLFRIAANLCRDRLRQRRRQMLAAAEWWTSGPEIEAVEDRTAIQDAVLRAVEGLPERYRAPVVLHYLREFSVAETAQALGRSHATVRVQVWRARGLLAAELDDWWLGGKR